MQSDTSMVDHAHLIKTLNPKEPDPLRRSDELHGHDWWLYHICCNKTGEESFWYPRLRGLREKDVQWSTDSPVVTKNMVVRTEKSLTWYLLG